MTDLDLHAVLREQFGLDEFRPGQEQIITALLGGRDVLAVLPTGAGKSLVFQLAAQLLPGLTVVIAPLLALMQDQVQSVAGQGISVGAISSDRAATDVAATLDALRAGALKLLYVTPERFANAEFMAALRGTTVSLLAVDEAHCVTDWGHSFRPAYLALREVAAQLGRPTLLALTATATPWVRAEISARLGLRRPLVAVHGSDRPNLLLEVRRVEVEHDDRRVLHDLLLGPNDALPAPLADQISAAMQGSGIIYTATTAAARATAAWLTGWGIAADYYHGQRHKAERAAVQERFMRGEIRVLVATNAFGLGIDKPDVRFVIHRDTPASLEAYYQEAGRAGRDGEFARCILIYRPGDLGRAAFLSGGGQLTRDEVLQAHPGLIAHPSASVTELQAATGLNRADLTRLLAILRREGITAERRGRIKLLRPDFDPAALPLDSEDARLAYEHSRLEMMRGYAETAACRRGFILNYFGEQYPAERCERCDNDLNLAGAERIAVAPTATVESMFALGDAVTHAAWGPGVVQRVTGDSLTVLFESAGYKTLATAVVQENNLLAKR